MINLLIVLYLLKIRIFNMTSVDTRIFNQAMDMPFEELEKFLSYISDIKKFITWNKLGLLSDESRKNLIIFLFKNNLLCGTLRLNLSIDESIECINAINESNQPLELRFWQGHVLTREHIENIESLKVMWFR